MSGGDKADEKEADVDVDVEAEASGSSGGGDGCRATVYGKSGEHVHLWCSMAQCGLRMANRWTDDNALAGIAGRVECGGHR
jgi:hypothetical protein